MDLEQKYKKETGFDVGKIHDTGTTYYSDDYVKWLEKQVKELRKHDVVGRSKQLVCDCGNPNLTWYGNDDDRTYFCFECKKEVTN